jgi:SAM-dependent methyltransferase
MYNLTGKLMNLNLPKYLQVLSPHENLLTGTADDYFNTGRSALEICKRIMLQVGLKPEHIVDFPSGYGRVLRWFKNEYPLSRITAVETDYLALEFVQQQFGADIVLANKEMDFNIPNDVDLIFSGSLLTHFNENQWDRFLQMTVGALAPGGVLVFTTHGRINALLAKVSHPMYGDSIDLQKIYSEYQAKKFAYQDYDESSPGFGFSLSAPSWVIEKLEKIPKAKIIYFEEGAWGQDVYAVQHNAEGPLIHT